jgi:hypothetical protein
MFIESAASNKDRHVSGVWKDSREIHIVAVSEERVVWNWQIHGLGKMYSLWMLNISRLGYRTDGPGFD